MKHSRPPQDLDVYVENTAKAFPYPPTPDLTDSVQQGAIRAAHRAARRLRLAQVALVALLTIGAAIIAVPEIRAGVLEFLRIGVVQIFFTDQTPTPLVSTPTPTPVRIPTRTPIPPPTPIHSILDLPGETTLEAAQQLVRFPIKLPTYPVDLGAPDRVSVQDYNGKVVTLVWLEAGSEDQAQMALQILNERVVASKFFPRGSEHATRVNGAEAYWLPDPHSVVYFTGSAEIERLTEMSVLVWQDGDVTYRLETHLPLEEAVKVAESMQ